MDLSYGNQITDWRLRLGLGLFWRLPNSSLVVIEKKSTENLKKKVLNKVQQPMSKRTKIPETYLQRLLESSIVYHSSQPEEITPLPDSFKNKTAAIKAFTQALHFEAHQSFREKLDGSVSEPVLFNEGN